MAGTPDRREVEAYWGAQTAMAAAAKDPVLAAKLWSRVLERLYAHEEHGPTIRLELTKATFRTVNENPALPGLYDDDDQAAHVLTKMALEQVDLHGLFSGLLEQPDVAQIVAEEGARVLLEADA